MENLIFRNREVSELCIEDWNRKRIFKEYNTNSYRVLANDVCCLSAHVFL